MRHWIIAGALAATSACGEDATLRERAEQALHRGVQFFESKVAVEGTFLWQYSEDLKQREGEGAASNTRGWIQPPSTPSVGMAFLNAHEATGDRYYLDAARRTATGLIRGQLRSGGWTYSVDFDPRERKKVAYRDGGGAKGRNTSTLDDDTTQSAIRFIARLDTVLQMGEATIHRASIDGIKSVLDAQYPNGAWPQGYDGSSQPRDLGIKSASYPSTWPRTWPGANKYWEQFTLNDNLMGTTIATLFDVASRYTKAADEAQKEEKDQSKSAELARRCRWAAMRGGEFLILAQMPMPQPAWAQQYSFEMHPAWARKFEPPAVTGGESQNAIETLLLLFRETSEEKYLKPIPRALDYLSRSRLSDGTLARFYELGSNKPLFFTKAYELTHDDSNLPTHYAFRVKDRTGVLRREYDRVAHGRTSGADKETSSTSTAEMEKEVERIVATQDSAGRWLEEGRLRFYRPSTNQLIIRTATFIRNVETLSQFLKSSRR